MLEKIRPIKEEELSLFESSYPSSKLFAVELDRVIEERCDELDSILEEEGYEILYRDYQTIATSIFNYRVYFYDPAK